MKNKIYASALGTHASLVDGSWRLRCARSQLRYIQGIVPLSGKKKKVPDALGILAEALVVWVSTRRTRRRCWFGADGALGPLLCSSSGAAIRGSWVIYTLQLFICSSGTAFRRSWVIYVTPRVHVPSEVRLVGSRIVADSAGK